MNGTYQSRLRLFGAIGLILLLCVLASVRVVRYVRTDSITAVTIPNVSGPDFSGVEIARLWVEPDDGPEPILNQLATTKTSLDISEYLITEPIVLRQLIGLHERGVKVRVILEETPFGSYTANREAIRVLEAASIPWRYGSPVYRYAHAKFAIIDNKRAIVMTSNLTKSAFASNREYAALIESPDAVRDIRTLFDADWTRTSYTPSYPGLVVSPRNSRSLLRAFIRAAKAELSVETEVLDDAEIERELIAAERRGVRVRLLMSPDLSDNTAMTTLHRLAGHGVEVRISKQPYIHAKAMLADRNKLYLGSVNFSDFSLDENRELGIITKTHSAIDEIRTAFESDWRSGIPVYPTVVHRDTGLSRQTGMPAPPTRAGTETCSYMVARTFQSAALWFESNDNHYNDIQPGVAPYLYQRLLISSRYV